MSTSKSTHRVPSLPSTPIAQLTGHNGPVNALTYSAHPQTYLLTGSSDRLIRLFNPSRADPPPSPSPAAPTTPSIRSTPHPKPHLASSTTAPAGSTSKPPGLVQTYAGHAHPVLDLAIAPSNTRFASVGGDRAVLVWDVRRGEVLRRLEGHAARVEAVRFAGPVGGDAPGEEVLVSGSFDGTLRIWDLRSNSGKPLLTFTDAKDGVTCVAASPAGWIWSGSTDGRVRGYDLRRGMIVEDCLGYPVTSLTLPHSPSPHTPPSAYLASTLDSALRLMDTASGACLQTFTATGYRNTELRTRAALAAHDGMVLAGDETGRVTAWEVEGGTVVGHVWHEGSRADGEGKSVRIKKEDGDEDEGKEMWKGQGGLSRGKGKGSGAVVSAAVGCEARREWASAGGDGMVMVWGDPEGKGRW